MGLLTAGAAALSAPVTKLIEVVSAGMGRAYEPLHLVRLARAEAKALSIMAHGAADVQNIETRAARRVAATEVWRQENLEAIAELAVNALPDQVSAVPVARDWVARFFEHCKDASNQDMRQLWARLLAGEVTRPNSFSLRTLALVAQLSAPEANDFNVLCLRCVQVDDSWVPFLRRMNSDYLAASGLTYNAVTRLEAAGLVQYTNADLLQRVVLEVEEGTRLTTRSGKSFHFAVPAGAEAAIPMGTLALSPSGEELAPLAAGPENIEYLEEEVFAPLRDLGWTVLAS